MLPILLTLAPFYGGGFQYLLNEAQHIGLTDKVSDYRINTRTILLNPLLGFLYWQMNYHIEHHMYAAVPFYHLAELHALVKDDLPHCPRGITGHLGADCAHPAPSTARAGLPVFARVALSRGRDRDGLC